MSGVSNMAKGFASIARLNKTLADLNAPTATIERIAGDVAKLLDAKVKAEYDAGQTIYDDARPLGVDGNFVPLIPHQVQKYESQNRSHHHPSGDVPTGMRAGGRAAPGTGKGKSSRSRARRTRSVIGFTSVGRIVRAVLPLSYQKFLVGRFRILPIKLPRRWHYEIRDVVFGGLKHELQAAGATPKGGA